MGNESEKRQRDERDEMREREGERDR